MPIYSYLFSYIILFVGLTLSIIRAIFSINTLWVGWVKYGSMAIGRDDGPAAAQRHGARKWNNKVFVIGLSRVAAQLAGPLSRGYDRCYRNVATAKGPCPALPCDYSSPNLVAELQLTS